MLKKRTRRSRHAAGLFDELVVDNFAGGGGASLGIERAMGRSVDVAINHNAEAVALHQANHPATIHYCESVWDVDPCEVTRGRKVGLAWFSPDCKHFSKAKGGKPVEKKIRGLAWVVTRWAAKVKPRVIMLENVREFETWGPLNTTWKCACGWSGQPKDMPANPSGVKVCPKCGASGGLVKAMLPCPRRKGDTFKRWVSTLRNLGYVVEWRCLDAADFGAPTHRKRLFLVARSDGEPIRWPSPSHGPGRGKPYRTAAECIDWSLPCPSIFLTKEEGRAAGVNRPLAEKTMRRIAMGLKRFVLDNPRPFIVRCDHGGDHFRGQGFDRPLATVAGKHGFGLTTPYLTAQFGERDGQQPRAAAVDKPIGVVTPRHGGGHPLVVPHITKFFGGVVGQEADQPLPTVTSVDHSGLVTALLTNQYGRSVGQTADSPAPTVTSVRHAGIVAASLVQYNQEKGGETRGKKIVDPLNTIPTANRFGLVSAFLSTHYGDRPDGSIHTGHAADGPAPTIVSRGTQNPIAAANLIKMNYGDKQWNGVDEPLRTILAGANHHGLVTSFLTKYFGTGLSGVGVDSPLPTITARDRFGLVRVDSEDYRIADIGLRMLRPRELYLAQGFDPDYRIEIQYNGKRLSTAAQVRMCGNSVSPPVAEALVRANFASESSQTAARLKAKGTA